jgi:membrane-bound lytic murein transglycosylase MltF
VAVPEDVMAPGSGGGAPRRRAAGRAARWISVLLLLAACGSEPDPDAADSAGAGGPSAAGDAAVPILPGHLGERFRGDLPEMRERRVVRALVSWSRTDFSVEMGEPHGLQVELLQQLETFLNRGTSRGQPRLRVVYVPVTFDDLLPALLEGRGDLAAAFLTVTREREQQVAFASGRGLEVNEVVVAHAEGDVPGSLDDLAGRSVFVMRGSSYAEHLRELSRKLVARGLRPIEIELAPARVVTEDILDMVNSGSKKLTVADDFRAELWARVMPRLRVPDDLVLHDGGHVGWAVRPGNPELLAALTRFMRKVDKGTLVGNVLFQRYYEDTRWIENPLDDEEIGKLETYAPLFRKYGDRYDLDPRALAAQAYQESGLDHDRTSRAGAVGLMQLLPRTAADPNVGIGDIHDVEQNVHAGARYMAFLRDRYFSDPEISEVDQLAFAWAAYNAGPATLRRARRRAEAMGLDPNRWFGNTEHAVRDLVGREPVRYVANIYKYYVAYQLADELGRELWVTHNAP